MGFELSVDPPTCPISAAGGVSKHKLTNHTDMQLAYKIKSSNNSNYSVNVVYGVLGVCEKAELVITRIKGPPKADHLTIQFVNVPAETKADAVKDLFASGPPKGEITGETAVKLSAAE